MTTFTGRRVYPCSLRATDVDLLDIAHSLAHQCRFAGHSVRFYSVAEHSLLVASLVVDLLKPSALLHDAAEAYLGDLIRPLKHDTDFGKTYEIIEKRARGVIFGLFGLPDKISKDVVWADSVVTVNEARQLLSTHAADWEWANDYPILNFRLKGMLPEEAKQMFLNEASRWIQK